MKFIIVPKKDIEEIFPKEVVDNMRTSIDGTEVIIHEEILAEKQVELGLMTLPNDSSPIEWTYPNYEYNTTELDDLLSSDKWTDNTNMTI